jgi:hypothetical protein
MMTSARTCLGLLAGLAALMGSTAPVHAAGPEQIEQLQLRRGDWRLGYYGQFGELDGSDEARQHSGTAFYGVTDTLALGGELQTRYRSGPGIDDRLYFAFDSAAALLTFSDREQDAVGAGLWLQAGMDSDGELARLEARAIVERKRPQVWARANAMLRRINQEDAEGTLLAYGSALQYAVVRRLWLGAEASGQAFRVAGFSRQAFEEGHYLGPSLNYELELGPSASLEVGIAYFRRLDADELRDTARLSLQLTF